MPFADDRARSRQGDPAAQEKLFERWRPLLRLQARRLLGAELSARVDPSDVVQDSLQQASQDVDKFRGTSQGEWVAWLRCIVAGQAAKTRRHLAAARRAVDREQGLPEGDLPDHRAGVADQILDAEEAARLAAALEALPAPMRDVVIRRVIIDWVAAKLIGAGYVSLIAILYIS